MLLKLKITAMSIFVGSLMGLFFLISGLLHADGVGIGLALLAVALGFVPLAVLQMPPFLSGRRKAQKFYSPDGVPLDDGARVHLQPVNQIRILPLVDYVSGDSGLETAAGVSYLIQFDDRKILFDLGLHPDDQPEAPLQRNMKTLGIELASIDAVVNSHPHADHLGAWPHEEIMRKYGPGLEGKPFYALGHLRVAPMELELVERPQALFPQLGTTGPLPCSLFLVNYTLEQSLVLDLEGCGLVVLVGCGHPGVEAIVERAEQIFQRPLYAVLGGFHFPVTQDRCSKNWFFKPQKLIGGPHSYPWRPIGRKDVERAIRFLKARGVEQIWLSAHDSCDWAIDRFASAFNAGGRIVVGKERILSCESLSEDQ